MHSVKNYIMVYFMVDILVISVLGGYLYRFFYNTVYADFLYASEQEVSTILSQHENNLQIVEDIIIQLGLADDITRFTLAKQPEKSTKLEKYLYQHVTVSQFFDMLLYYYHMDDYMYNHMSSVEVKSFFENGFALADTSAEELKNIMDFKGIDMRVLPEQNISGEWIGGYLGINRKFTLILKSVAPEFDETVMFFVPSAYYDNLLKVNDDEISTKFMYYNDQIIVLRGNDNILKEHIMNLISEEHITEMPEKFLQKKITISGNKYLLTWEKGVSGIYYGYLRTMDTFYNKIEAEQWVIILLLMICVIPVSLIVVFNSTRLLRKVKGMSSLLNDEVTYDLNTIERGIQTLVDYKKVSEVENLSLKKARAIRNFIMENEQSREKIIEEAAGVGLNFDYAFYIVVLIKNGELGNKEKMHSLILEIIEKEEDVDGYGIHLVNNNQNLFVLFGDRKEEIEEILQKIMGIEKSYCQDFVIATSNYHTDFSTSSKAYLEADTTFDHHFLVGNSEIIRFMDIVQSDYVSLSLEKYTGRLRQAIRNSDKDEVHRVVKDICQKLKEEKASLYAYRILYNDILQILMAEWKNDTFKFEQYCNVFALSQCFNIQDFYELLSEICCLIIDKRQGKERETSNIAKEAIEYMHKNYHDSELTMNSLAEYLQMSAVSLSIEFKNELEMNPSEYLANLRMNKAKELLRNTDMLIKDVGTAVGYEDDRSFRRRFKKYTGVTPAQYRDERI